MTFTDRSPGVPNVLIVEDDESTADTYEFWLEPQYDVQVATSGVEGLTHYDKGTDIVLSCRGLSDLSGTTVMQTMERIKIQDQRALLTPTEPDQSIVELPCHEYLIKPVSKSELQSTINELQTQLELDQKFQECFRIQTKIAALKEQDTPEDDSTLADLNQQLNHVQTEINTLIDELDGTKEVFKLID